MTMSLSDLYFVVWNVRGLNSLARRLAIFNVVSVARPIMVCLQETKMEIITDVVV